MLGIYISKGRVNINSMSRLALTERFIDLISYQKFFQDENENFFTDYHDFNILNTIKDIDAILQLKPFKHIRDKRNELITN